MLANEFENVSRRFLVPRVEKCGSHFSARNENQNEKRHFKYFNQLLGRTWDLFKYIRPAVGKFELNQTKIKGAISCQCEGGQVSLVFSVLYDVNI